LVTVKTMGTWITQLNFQKMQIILPEGSTIKNLLEELSRRIPHFSKVALLPNGQPRIIQRFLVNGRSIRYLQVLDTPLQEGDIVAIFPAVAGGGSQHL